MIEAYEVYGWTFRLKGGGRSYLHLITAGSATVAGECATSVTSSSPATNASPRIYAPITSATIQPAGNTIAKTTSRWENLK